MSALLRIPMVRPATLDDLPVLLERGRAFHAYSPWASLPWDDDAAEGTLRHLIEADTGVIFMSEGGICGGLVNGLYFSPSTRIAVELFWYVPKNSGAEGTELRQAFEGWAKDQGAEAVQFSALGDGRRAATERLYRMAGYTVSETAFLKFL